MKFSILKLSLIVASLAISVTVYAQTASILPPAKTTFFDSNGKPLANGKIDFYIPGTTTRKMTWQDSGQTIPNTNPVVLDTAGRAIILGDGSYRQRVTDKNGNLIWDQITSSTGSGGGGGSATVGDGDAVGTIKAWSGFTAPNQYVFAYGQEFARSSYPELFAAITSQQNVSCTSGSSTLTGLADTSQLSIGSSIETSCLNSGSTVISKTVSSIVASSNAIISTNTTIRFFPFGNGDGNLTFNLPDLRGRVLSGRDNMGGIAANRLNLSGLGASGGSQSQTLITDNLPPYTPSGTVNINDPGHAHTLPSPNAIITGNGQSGGEANRLAGVGGSATGLSFTGITATFSGNAQGGVSAPLSIIQPTQIQNYIIKVLPDTNPNSYFGVASIGGMTGVITCGIGLTCSGNNISAVNSPIPIELNVNIPLTFDNINNDLHCPQCSLNFDSVSVASLSNIPSYFNQIVTRGYYTSGDGGGGIYNKVISMPSHNLYIHSADGAYWELQPTNGKVLISQAGAKGDGIFNNQSALDNAYAYSIVKKVQLYFDKAGIYNHSDVWALGSSSCIHPNIDAVGPDNAVTVTYTGFTVLAAHTLDAGPSANCFGAQIGMTGRILFRGNASSDEAFRQVGYHKTFIRISVGDAAVAGYDVIFTVESELDITHSINIFPITVKPTYGMIAQIRNPGEFSSGNRAMLQIEGCTNGFLNNGMAHTVFYGTLEGCAGFGYQGTTNAKWNTFQNVDNEANGGTDWSLLGESGSTFMQSLGASPTAPNLAINSGSDRNMFKGGVYGYIGITSGASFNSFENVSYYSTGTFSDAGTGTTWKNLCVTVPGGGGTTCTTPDKLSFSTLPITQGGTGQTTARNAMAALKGVYTVGCSAVAASTTGSTTENTLATVTIPANSMGLNGRIEVKSGWNFTNGGSPNNRVVRTRFGSQILNVTSAASTALGASVEAGVQNRNATNSQVPTGAISTTGGWGVSTTAASQYTIDTTLAQNITLTAQLTDAGDTATLNNYCVYLIVP